jgi:hypothetical protein
MKQKIKEFFIKIQVYQISGDCKCFIMIKKHSTQMTKINYWYLI